MAATIEKVKARLPPAVDHRRGDPAGWIGWIVIPSWLLSLALHTALLCVMAFVLHRPSGFGTSGFGDGETGIYAGLGNGTAPGLPGDGTGLPIGETVGIFDGPAQGAAGAREAGTSESASNSALKAPQRPRALDDGDADDAPPVALDLPAAPKVARLGFGSAAPAGSAGDARDMIKSSGRTNSAGRGGSADGSGDGGGGEGPGGGGGAGGSGGGGGGGSGGGTSFFGQKANGSRFVYVLDASGSMYDYNAIAVAKAELLASLSLLNSTQQFQVIFYNEKCHPMPNAEGKFELVWGTDTNRTLASQFIRNVQPDGGTRHLEALLMALGYGPEVIFFLTDAGEPILYPGDLEKIKKRNNGRSTIHTIEFGKGANLRADNFLKKLARENGGKHAYRDVQEFRKK